MTIYDIWDVVVVPFPFVEIAAHKSRPVLILSNHKFNDANNQFLCAMITTAKKSQWPGDTTISDLAGTGLAVASIVRLKLFTLPASVEPRKIGSLNQHDIKEFQKNWKAYLF